MQTIQTMKKYLNAILVVEGKEDASYLSNYIESEIVVVNGYDIKKSLISYLVCRKVIILTDPDEAGKSIRKTLNEKLPNAINVEIDITKCDRGNKNGVAECQIDEIMEKLSPYFVEAPKQEEVVTAADLMLLGVYKDKQLKNYICKELKIGECNNRQMHRRIYYNRIKLDTIKKLVEQYKNGN